MNKHSFQIAIDGPVGAGKSTVARLVAEELGWLYVYTGAMYRAAALLAEREGVALEDGEWVAELVETAEWKMRMPTVDEQDGRMITLELNGEDVSVEILTERVSTKTPIVAAQPPVRTALVKKQQEIAGEEDVVMEGRDIGTRVLPTAQLKIYLTASEEERARRQHSQVTHLGDTVSFEEVLQNLKQRDKQDMERKTDPLTIAPGAWVLDTTGMDIEEVVTAITERVAKMR